MLKGSKMRQNQHNKMLANQDTKLIIHISSHMYLLFKASAFVVAYDLGENYRCRSKGKHKTKRLSPKLT